jgi:hypothetical protein
MFLTLCYPTFPLSLPPSPVDIYLHVPSTSLHAEFPNTIDLTFRKWFPRCTFGSFPPPSGDTPLPTRKSSISELAKRMMPSSHQRCHGEMAVMLKINNAEAFSHHVRSVLSRNCDQGHWRLPPAPLNTIACHDHSEHPCPHELWIILDLTHEDWRPYSKFTLRLSWPASVSRMSVAAKKKHPSDQTHLPNSILQTFPYRYIIPSLCRLGSPSQIVRTFHTQQQLVESMPVYVSWTLAFSPRPLTNLPHHKHPFVLFPST